jgi:hypothetical protein
MFSSLLKATLYLENFQVTTRENQKYYLKASKPT